eukprot:jgi/Mesen1/1548/ME000134S00667
MEALRGISHFSTLRVPIKASALNRFQRASSLQAPVNFFHFDIPRREHFRISSGSSNPYISTTSSIPLKVSRKVMCSVSTTNVDGLDSNDNAPATDAEKEAWEMRKKEAAPGVGPQDEWRWTLNWDAVTPDILIGSCPRSPSDLDRIVDEAGATAILNLQSDICFEALQIPYSDILSQAMARGVFLERVPVRDFDRGDQALMLPEAVRMLHMLVTRGCRVYVHCTAGINRASLTVLGYLTFVQGMSLDEALLVVKGARKVAHPYVECWTEVKTRLLDGKGEELTMLATGIYKERCEGGVHGNAQTDWSSAQTQTMARIFKRWLEVDMGALQVERELTLRSSQKYVESLQAQVEKLTAELEGIRSQQQLQALSPAPGIAETSASDSATTTQESQQQEEEDEDAEAEAEEEEDQAAATSVALSSQRETNGSAASQEAPVALPETMAAPETNGAATLAAQDDAKTRAEEGAQEGEARDEEEVDDEGANVDVYASAEVEEDGLEEDWQCNVITRENDGEGAEREPAALLPNFLCSVSAARICKERGS